MSWAVGIDIGGTAVKAVAVTAAGGLLRQSIAATRDGEAGPAEWTALATEAIRAFAREQGGDPIAVGVCAPGLAAPDERSIAHLPGKLAGLAGIDWTRALGRTARVPVLNDAHAALVGEAWVGAAQGKRHVVMVTLGTGVGGAVMSDGRLMRGAMGRAGHLGHMSLDPEGPVSITGMPGAIEIMIGECTVARRTGGRFVSTEALVAAHRASDAGATEAWLRSIRAFGCAVASYINLFDPEVVVIGGGIARAGDALLVPLRAVLDRVEWRPGGHGVPLQLAQLGENAGAIGAARYALSLS